jgi:hypothetical protein
MSTAVRVAGLRTRVMTESVCSLGTWLNSLLLNSVLCNSRNMASSGYNWLWVTTVLTTSRELLSWEQVRLWLFVKTLDWILIQLACALIECSVSVNCIGAVTVPRLSNGSFLRAPFSAPRHVVKNHGFFGNLIFKSQSSAIWTPIVIHLLWVVNTVQFGSERDSYWDASRSCGSYSCGCSLGQLPWLS